MGLPGLRCASMPFADADIFNFWPGVAAGWFRALGALLVVAAAVDMEAQNNNRLRGQRASSVDRDQAMGRGAGKGRLLGDQGQQRWTLAMARAEGKRRRARESRTERAGRRRAG